jgi:hypothetical protein
MGSIEETKTLDSVKETKKRPGFLTVICILSFVGIGLAILSSIYSVMTLPFTINTLRSNPVVSMFGMNLEEYLPRLETYGKLVYSISILANFACLVGVIMMWKLKKMGFYLYSFFEILPVILSIVLLGNAGGIFGQLGLVFAFLFPIAFIIMYAVNLKHMNE